MGTQRLAEHLRRISPTPMTEEEVAFLRDFQAFIEFAIRNGLSFHATMAFLSHDFMEFSRYGYDFEATMSHGFLPRVKGFTKKTADAIGESDESDDESASKPSS